MRPLLARPAAVLGTVALAATAVLAAAVPAEAATDVPLTVNVVDQYGRPVAGVLQGYDTTGSSIPEVGGGGFVLAATHTYTVPSGAGYAFSSITPWSGVECFGVAPCVVSSSPTSWTPVVNVPADTPTTFTVRVTVPTVTGGSTVGSPLTVQIPEGIQRLNAAVLASGPPYSGLSTTILNQWTRGGADIAGATSSSYTTVRDDGGQAVAARLTPSPAVAAIFAPAGGVQPFTTNSIAVAKAVPLKTRTKVNVAKRFRASEKVTMTVRVKAKGSEPDGKVTVTIGKFKTSKRLDEGEALVNLPRLAPGTYRVSVRYAGSDGFKKSKAKKITLTVTR